MLPLELLLFLQFLTHIGEFLAKFKILITKVYVVVAK
jgi:hypothetical protein